MSYHCCFTIRKFNNTTNSSEFSKQLNRMYNVISCPSVLSYLLHGQKILNASNQDLQKEDIPNIVRALLDLEALAEDGD